MACLMLLLDLFFIQVVFLPTSEALKNGFTIQVEPGAKECFYEEIKSNVSLDVEYQVKKSCRIN